jgi:hypothetical protein
MKTKLRTWPVVHSLVKIALRTFKVLKNIKKLKSRKVSPNTFQINFQLVFRVLQVFHAYLPFIISGLCLLAVTSILGTTWLCWGHSLVAYLVLVIHYMTKLERMILCLWVFHVYLLLLTSGYGSTCGYSKVRCYIEYVCRVLVGYLLLVVY